MPKKNKQSSTTMQELTEQYASARKKSKNVSQKFSGEDCYNASKIFAAEHVKKIPRDVNIKDYIQGIRPEILLSYISIANPSIISSSLSTKYIEDFAEKKNYIDKLNNKLLKHGLKINDYDKCINNIKSDTVLSFSRKLECIAAGYELVLDYLEKCNKNIFKEKGSKQKIFDQIFINNNVLHNIYMLLKYQEKFQKFGFNVEKVIPFLERKDCANIIMLGLDDEKFVTEFNKTSSYDLTSNFCRIIQMVGRTILYDTFKRENAGNAKLKLEGDPIINAFLYAKSNDNKNRITVHDCNFIYLKIRNNTIIEDVINISSATYRLT